jgi:alkanesulfonate monooxygenase SsuD/methylene tetrahydromethanopterin reductase-like flavin-dependent oxidoreductase (luciferase family)
MAQGAWLVGTADDVGEQLVELRDALGLEYLTLFPHFPGMVREQVIEQMERFADDVRPALLGGALSAAGA